jgi:hypothetical protein
VRLLELICLSCHCKFAVAVLQLKFILGVGPKVKDSIEVPSGRRLGWKAFVLG